MPPARPALRPPVPPAPMLATAGAPPRGTSWVIEPKFDGARNIARIGAGRPELFSRQATNLSSSFPEVVDGCAAALGGRGAILDGEIIVLDHHGRPNFGRLQRRLNVQRPQKTLRHSLPARYVVFDILHLDGRDLTALPYRERRGVLEGLNLGADSEQITLCPSWTGIDGADVLAAMADAGMEGVVAKSITSPYQAGRRSRLWIKTPHRMSGLFTVGGFLPSAAHPDWVGSLLVGAHDAAGDFVYCGHITVGFSHRSRRDLHALLTPLRRDTSPFRTMHPAAGALVHWVDPRVVGRIEYREYTGRLRHSAWKGVALSADPSATGIPRTR